MRSIIYSCHQPNFLPWIGYFHKIISSDFFVILDEVQYTKNSVANRNKIKSSQGEQLITVPISKKINNKSFFSYREANFAQDQWHKKIIKSIEQNYKSAEYYDKYKEVIFEILKMDSFVEMNINFIKFIVSEFDIDTKILLMSELNELSGMKNDLIISIGNCLNANVYLSGNGARNYNDPKKFEENGITLKYQEFVPQEYSQLFPPFMPYLSMLDMLFNEGNKGKSFMNKQNL